jgi:glycosyltransferase involved in cell wall biosynthesis
LKPTSLSQSLIICTKDRPHDLERCIESVLAQTRPPNEIILVDDGSTEVEKLETRLLSRGIHFIYHKKSFPGLTASRNIGVRLASGDIITFIDDDVILDCHYNEVIMQIFEQDFEKQIAGATGALTSQITPLKHMFLKFFLLSGDTPGAILPSGNGVLIRTANLQSPAKVEWLSGCNMSFRKEIFQEYTFNEKDYQLYGWGEDRDFSYRVSRNHCLMAHPFAKVTHNKTTISRLNSYIFGKMELYNLFLFFEQNMPHRFVNILSLTWAIVGILLKNTLKCLSFKDLLTSINQLRGNINGLLCILNKHKT